MFTENLAFAYPGAGELRFPDIACPPGSELLVLGQSGSGKTTLLQLLAGLRTAGSGTVRLAGTELAALSGAQRDRYRGRHVGIVFQQAHFLRSLRVDENLALARTLAGLPADAGLITALLERLGLAHKQRSRTTALSVGEQQRVAIARALVCGPELILADEPTSALDDRNAAAVVTLLREQAAAAGATLLIVTHDQRLKDAFANRIEL
ncbi:MAG: ATP-binding cassette domain-containing protein [Saprospiraceae bacterium]